MAKVEHRKARKDYPDAGIKKGDMYYFAAVKTGPYSSKTIRQKEPIKPSQLTNSEYLSRLYEWEESKNAAESMEAAELLADEIRELGEEQQEKLDDMPEGLQQGSTGELLQERADACEAAAEEIDQIRDEWESARDEFQDRDKDDPDYDADEEFDESEFLEALKEVCAE